MNINNKKMALDKHNYKMKVYKIKKGVWEAAMPVEFCVGVSSW